MKISKNCAEFGMLFVESGTLQVNRVYKLKCLKFSEKTSLNPEFHLDFSESRRRFH